MGRDTKQNLRQAARNMDAPLHFMRFIQVQGKLLLRKLTTKKIVGDLLLINARNKLFLYIYYKI